MIQVDEHQWVQAAAVQAVTEDLYEDGWLTRVHLPEGFTLVTKTRAADLVARLETGFNTNEMAFKVEGPGRFPDLEMQRWSYLEGYADRAAERDSRYQR